MDAFNLTVRLARRIVVTVVGVTILVLGIIMIVAPGPAIIVIPIGLTILGLEFAWARIWLRRLRRSISAGNSTRRGERAERHRDRHMRL